MSFRINAVLWRYNFFLCDLFVDDVTSRLFYNIILRQRDKMLRTPPQKERYKERLNIILMTFLCRFVSYFSSFAESTSFEAWHLENEDCVIFRG
jgi:hypothetical protein